MASTGEPRARSPALAPSRFFPCTRPPPTPLPSLGHHGAQASVQLRIAPGDRLGAGVGGATSARPAEPQEGGGRAMPALLFWQRAAAARPPAPPRATLPRHHLAPAAWSYTYEATAWISSGDSWPPHAGMAPLPLVT